MQLLVRFFLLLLLVLSIRLSAKGETREADFTFADGLIWVDVSVPGRAVPLHFVLDTGAGATVLDIQTARDLGLALSKTVVVQGTQGKAAAYRISSFRGSLMDVAMPEQVIALDLQSISRTCHRRIDGLVGADFFKKQVVQIDYAAGRLRVGEACELPCDAAIKLQLTRRNDAWCLKARVDGNEAAWLRVDTGFDGGLSWWPGRERSTDSESGMTVGFSSETDCAIKTSMELGGVQFDDIDTTVLQRRLFPNESGLLGNQILSKYRVTFDFDRKQLTLESQTP